MSQKSRPELPAVWPRPQSIETTPGTTELSADVRLSTLNVVPFMRKTMRSIFTEAGVRVVANKKRFVINVEVVEPGRFDLAAIPEAARGEFYEMTVADNVVTVRAPTQLGAIWGTQTFADIFALHGTDRIVPNCRIRDWPTCRCRGVSVAAGWTCARMRLDEWSVLVDRLATAKVNTLMLDLFGPGGAGQPPQPEFLMVPFPSAPDFKTENALTWSKLAEPQPGTDTLPPVMQAEGFLGQVVSYGQERGVGVVPVLDFAGPSAVLTKAFPVLAAAGGNGAICLSSAAARECIEKLYSEFVGLYFPQGLAFLGLRGEAFTGAASACSCKACRAQPPREAGAAYVAWLAGMLATKGVHSLVIPGEMILDAAGKPSERAFDALKKAADRLVIRWAVPPSDPAKFAAVLAKTAKAGMRNWVLPVTEAPNWAEYPALLKAVAAAVPLAASAHVQGVVTATVPDAGWVSLDRTLAAVAWNPTGFGKTGPLPVQRRSARYAGIQPQLDAAREQFLAAAAKLPVALGRPLPKDSAGVDTWLKDALAELAKGKDDAKHPRLTVISESASKVIELLRPLISTEEGALPLPDEFKALLGEAAQIRALAGVLALLRDAKKGKEKEAGAQAAKLVTAAMAEMPGRKASGQLPHVMGGLCALRSFLAAGAK